MTRFREIPAAFDSAELAILEGLYEQTCRDLGIEPVADDGEATNRMRAAVVKALMEAAQLGDWNRQLLRTYALLAAKNAR